MFTAFLVVQLLGDDLDKSLAEIVPELRSEPKFHSVRIRHLLAHMAGLPRESPCFSGNCDISNINATEYLKYLAKNSLFILDVGVEPSYSNFGFSILGRLVLETSTGLLWEDLVHQNIIQPLSLTSIATSYFNLSANAKKRVAPGFDVLANQSLPPPGINPQWNAPMEGIWSSVSDLTLFVQEVMNIAEGGKSTLKLSPASARFWLNEMMYTNPDGSGFGLVWEITQNFGSPAGSKVLGKSGSLYGYLAQVSFIPKLRLSYVALVSGGANLDQWRADAFSTLLPPLDDFINESTTFASVAPLPPNAEAYPGVYISPISKALVAIIQLVTLPNGNDKILGMAMILNGVKYRVLLRQPPKHSEDTILQMVGSYLGSDCMLAESIGFEFQYVLFQKNETTIFSLSVPGIVYGIPFDRT